MYKKDIVSSLAIILVFVSLIYFSSLKGKFVWFAPSLDRTAFFTLSQISTWSIILSFFVLLALFILFFYKSR
ncbi:MAG: hypothetical protein DRP00_00585 [Candidatus Aenigmatarchaeota archaeon]|nr:MAG: hypothetical protein DRP00_00585 [Candidatus Aenigmarchaeota archaeon]